MNVRFDNLKIGAEYSREDLASIWGYRGYQALARGVVTPRETSYIILFVTENKSSDRVPYADRLTGDELVWEGPTDHFAEKRMFAVKETKDEIHLFYREQQRSPFEYKGQVDVIDAEILTSEPSKFHFGLHSEVKVDRVAEKPPRFGTDWDESELLVAFNLYCQIPFGTIHMRNPKIIDLAALLGRSVGSVSLKLANLARHDPELQARGILGLQKGSKLETKIWKKFYQEPEKLAFESEIVLAKISGQEIEDRLEKLSGLERYKPTERTDVVRTRLNQQFFRRTVLAAYDNHCAVTGLPDQRLIKACHIIPWAKDKRLRMDPRNGLPINSLHHDAFDLGIIYFDSELKVRFSSKLPEADCDGDREAFEWMKQFEGNELRMPKRFFPDPKHLAWHRQNVAEVRN